MSATAQRVTLDWQGPFSFARRDGQSILCADEAKASGIYVWVARTSLGKRVHYVGETGESFAERHLQHFEAYATGVYSTKDSARFVDGEDVVLFPGTYWRKALPSARQDFVENFATYAAHVARNLDAIDLFIAPFAGNRRERRRVESALVGAIYDSPVIARELFPSNFRRWTRRPDEDAMIITSQGSLPFTEFPDSIEA